MKIESLPLPSTLLNKYKELGITDLYPPQEESINHGLLDRKNQLIAIPTASGKTFIAELAMHNEISNGGKCLYIVPLKALASEKYDDFCKKYGKVGIATGDPDQRDNYLSQYDIIVATSEKTDSLLRNKAEWLEDISLLVVDEIHLIGDPTRGPTLEMVISKLRYINPNMQIIGLSATLGNPDELAKWLDADLITTEWRPVDLKEGVFFNGKINFHKSERTVPIHHKDADINLLLDTLNEGGQCLVFVSSRRSAEAYAKKAALILKNKVDKLDDYSNRIKEADTTSSGKVLADSILWGVAFHHAGLPRKARETVEEGFRKGDIKVIASTPTLAAGLNLPARRVIIRDYKRYESGEGLKPIPIMEYKQMAGRAGRPRLDPYGESILIAKDEDEVTELFSDYIDQDPEKISSHCQNELELRNHILSLIVSGIASNRSDINAFMERSFYASQVPTHRRLERNINKALDYLLENNLVKEDNNVLTSTRFGNLASQLYLDTETASLILNTINEKDTFSVLGMLHLLCMTNDIFRFYLKASDQNIVDNTLFKRSEELWYELDYTEEYYSAVKTALVVEDWCEEIPDDIICEKFGIGNGDLHNLIENIQWLSHATSRISHYFIPNFEEDINKLHIRIKNGIKEELLPLISLRG
ncbi:MAG TPA: ATP-dependent DNA helicase, partial [Methanocorpusculum sp.]|nr:ATP-dependent DNA helicase [Methanocorpusculum sp.]